VEPVSYNSKELSRRIAAKCQQLVNSRCKSTKQNTPVRKLINQNAIVSSQHINILFYVLNNLTTKLYIIDNVITRLYNINKQFLSQ
jgi:hypothetical protein